MLWLKWCVMNEITSLPMPLLFTHQSLLYLAITKCVTYITEWEISTS